MASVLNLLLALRINEAVLKHLEAHLVAELYLVGNVAIWHYFNHADVQTVEYLIHVLLQFQAAPNVLLGQILSSFEIQQ